MPTAIVIRTICGNLNGTSRRDQKIVETKNILKWRRRNGSRSTQVMDMLQKYDPPFTTVRLGKRTLPFIKIGGLNFFMSRGNRKKYLRRNTVKPYKTKEMNYIRHLIRFLNWFTKDPGFIPRNIQYLYRSFPNCGTSTVFTESFLVTGRQWWRVLAKVFGSKEHLSSLF